VSVIGYLHITLSFADYSGVHALRLLAVLTLKSADMAALSGWTEDKKLVKHHKFLYPALMPMVQ
jgi:hypothetical protein